MKQLFTLLVVLVICVTATHAQKQEVSGNVSDQESGEPLIGATILIRETGTGTVADFNGDYTVSVEPGQTLVISFTGYETVELTVGAAATYNVTLSYASQALEEIVVVGYGSQRSKDLTSAISVVNADEIAKTPSSSAMQGLQGKVAGLQVVSSGAPGGSPTIRVRGVGSYNADQSKPLYVVDGVFLDDIGFLNPADIASINILKDASAAAIYGVRAANGVVLIETKSGSYNQKATVSYDGYYGAQVATNVLQMANSEQFAQLAQESGSVPDMEYILNSMQRYGRSRVNPNVPNVNTDWYKEVLRPAAITNHNLNFSGGSDIATFSVSGGYFFQEGILDMLNDFERFNGRAKLEVKATDWLKVGGNVVLTKIEAQEPEYGAWNSAYFAVPVLPVIDEANTTYWPQPYANAKDLGYRGPQNPFLLMSYNDNFRNERNTLGNFFAEVSVLDSKIKFKTQYNYFTESIDRRLVDLPYYIGELGTTTASIQNRRVNNVNGIWDNTLTYDNSFGPHNLTVMGGTSYRSERYDLLATTGRFAGDVTGSAFPVDDKSLWYYNGLDGLVVDGLATENTGAQRFGLAYFGRVAYNYKHKYLLYGTFRADGTSKYQDKWGYFPSVGAGWVVSEESFFNSGVIDYLKLRGSWGKLGNDRIAPSDGALVASPRTTAIDDMPRSGYIVAPGFSFLSWETVEESNIGLSSYLLNNRLSIEADYYVRNTTGAVIPVTIPVVGGSTRKNAGELQNSGIELGIGWSDNASQNLRYSISANIATLKNEVIDLYGQPYLDAGMAEFRQRYIVGEPILAFYGREVAGVYQNQAEIDADPVAVAEGLEPGDFKYKDQNGDGMIDDDDRVVLGSYLPKLTYGGNIGVGFKGLELSVYMYGQSGNKILNRKRGEVIWTPDLNTDADFAKNRWHGEGTTNAYPSAKGIRKGWNQKMSDYFVEDGSFFRIQNVQLAYTLSRNSLTDGFPEARISLTADRPLTFFDYNGFNPEVSDGIDTQTYPVPATYTIGLNLTF